MIYVDVDGKMAAAVVVTTAAISGSELVKIAGGIIIIVSAACVLDHISRSATVRYDCQSIPMDDGDLYVDTEAEGIVKNEVSNDTIAGEPASPNNGKKNDNGKLSLKRISDSLLRKCGLDAHKIKAEYLGKKAEISRYDLFYDTKTGIIYILTKAGEIAYETYYNLKDIMQMY